MSCTHARDLRRGSSHKLHGMQGVRGSKDLRFGSPVSGHRNTEVSRPDRSPTPSCELRHRLVRQTRSYRTIPPCHPSSLPPLTCISKLPVLGQVLHSPRWRSCSPSGRFGGSMLAEGGSSPMSLNRLRLAGLRTS